MHNLAEFERNNRQKAALIFFVVGRFAFDCGFEMLTYSKIVAMKCAVTSVKNLPNDDGCD